MMDLLVDSPEDVEILVRNGIIENWLSNNEAVATLFYNLSRENIVSRKNFYFSDVLEDLNNYSGRDWPRWKANLRQNYFQNPWSIISVIAAAFLLLLTIIQAVHVFYYSNRLESTLSIVSFPIESYNIVE
jgi:hypothetical protein